MFKIGDEVKIDFELKSVNKINDNALADIKKWDKKCKSIHKITNIFTSGLWTEKEVQRVELDGVYVFFVNEINKTE